MRTLVHAQRKNQQNKLEDRNNKTVGLQTISPTIGKLRVACWRASALCAAGRECANCFAFSHMVTGKHNGMAGDARSRADVRCAPA